VGEKVQQKGACIVRRLLFDRHILQLALKSIGRCASARAFRVSLMLGLWLMLSALTVSPSLHHVIHDDSQSISHECLVTLLSKGHLSVGVLAAAAICLILVFFGLVFLTESLFLPRLDRRLAPSRAPPCAPLLLVVAG